MKTLILSVLLACTATQSIALSCMRPDPVQSFHRATEVPEPIYILHGRLTFDESLLPVGMVNTPREPAPIPARFEGMGLTLNGFTSRFERQVVLQSICFGPWCGREVSGEDSLLFAKVVGDQIIIESDPCGGNVFYDPTQDVLDQMTSCIRGEVCEVSNF